MRTFTNLFLSILFPATILFIFIATSYYLTTFDFTKALRLGTILGILVSVGFTILLSLIILILKKIHTSSSSRSRGMKVKKNPIVTSGPIDQKLMLLMDKELAFEVALHAMEDQDIGDTINVNEQTATLEIRTGEEYITLNITSLTKHTSEIHIKTNKHSKNVQYIINYIKTKEHSFMDY